MPVNNTALDTASPYRVIWKLSWPQMLTMFFHFWIGFVDVYVAGMLDKNVQASLGLIAQSLFFFLILAIAVANGSVAAISQSLGAGLHKRVRRYVGLCLEMAVFFSVLILCAGFFLKGVFLDLLQVPPEIAGITEYFLEVYLLVLPAYYLLIVTNAVFRARKKVFPPLYAMILITTVNTLGDFGLGLGLWGLPALGYKGLAWTTFFAVLCGAAFNLIVLRREKLIQRESFPPWRWIRRAAPYLFKVAWPTGMMQLLWQTGYLVLFAITASLPHGNITALAGMAAGIRIESLLFLPAFALNMTAGILVGNFLGAGKPGEAKRFGYRIWRIGLIFISVATLGVWLGAGPVAALLSPDPAVRLEIVNYLFYNLLAMPFTLTAMVFGGVFVGAGATIYNMGIFGAAVWCVRLPLAYILGHLVIGTATGVWAAMLVSMAIQAMVMLYFYSSKDWARFSMVKRSRGPAPADTAI
ncbi:MAG: MATE family efflux transporter [Thermodesulfobacteriota bacterium]|nr:MATE family efflux transporter [Thermodesulfobacteriota bacterium]